MTLRTTLYKTLIVITIASFIISFYIFKTKKGNLQMEKNKSEVNGELEKKNSELKKETPKLEEKVQEVKNKHQDLSVKNLRLKDEEPGLEQKIQELEKKMRPFEEKNVKLNEKKPEVEFCKPKRNILFLKTHKTASTTLMKLFHRFANRNQLIVAEKVGPYGKFNRCSIYPLKPGNEYNIFTHHTMFNYEEMKHIMPEDTTFLTILRDPVAQFQSAYSYFLLEEVYGMNISTFADLNTSLPEWSRVKNLRRDGQMGRNTNAFDLGIDPELFDDEEAILRKVQELDQQFHLVMITELFNESMILMKEKLCWDELSDVTGLKSNVRSSSLKVHLSSEQKENLRRMNRADQILYDYFYEKFLRQIDAFGKKKMEEEVKKLRALTDEIHEICVNTKIVSSPNTHIEKIQTRFRAGARKHEVCRAIMNDEMSEGYKKFSKKKFEKANVCNN